MKLPVVVHSLKSLNEFSSVLASIFLICNRPINVSIFIYPWNIISLITLYSCIQNKTSLNSFSLKKVLIQELILSTTKAGRKEAGLGIYC